MRRGGEEEEKGGWWVGLVPEARRTKTPYSPAHEPGRAGRREPARATGSTPPFSTPISQRLPTSITPSFFHPSVPPSLSLSPSLRRSLIGEP